MIRTHFIEGYESGTRRYRVTVLSEAHCVVGNESGPRRYRMAVLTEAHCC